MHRLSSILSAALLLFPARNQTPTLAQLLVSVRNPTTTAVAKAQLENLCKAHPKSCLQLTKLLPAMLLADQDFKVVQSEARLVVELKIYSAIPALATHMEGWDPTVIMGFTHEFDLSQDPVAHALSEMGDVAVPALARPLTSSDIRARDRAIRTLLLIDTPASMALLASRTETEPDPGLRAMIRFWVASKDAATPSPPAAPN